MSSETHFSLDPADPFRQGIITTIADWVADRIQNKGLSLPVSMEKLADPSTGLPISKGISPESLRSFIRNNTEDIQDALNERITDGPTSTDRIFDDLPTPNPQNTEEKLIQDAIDVAAERVLKAILNEGEIDNSDIVDCLEQSPVVGEKSDDFWLKFVREHYPEIEQTTWNQLMKIVNNTWRKSGSENGLPTPEPDPGAANLEPDFADTGTDNEKED